MSTVSVDEPCEFCHHPRYAHREKVISGSGGEYWPCRAYECSCGDYAFPGTVSVVQITDNGNSP